MPPWLQQEAVDITVELHRSLYPTAVLISIYYETVARKAEGIFVLVVHIMYAYVCVCACVRACVCVLVVCTKHVWHLHIVHYWCQYVICHTVPLNQKLGQRETWMNLLNHRSKDVRRLIL